MSSYLSPNKKGLEYSSAYSPATTTLRKPTQNQNNTFSTNATPGNYGSELEQLLNERNNYKASFHKSEMELLKAQQEMKALQDQIDYYKAKSLASPAKSIYQRELENSPMKSPNRPNNTPSVKEEALEMEISRLRKQLIEKSQQTEDWMKRATRAEIIAKGDVNLPEELQLKQQEIDKLNREMTQLQLKSQEVGKMEREIKDLKALLDFKEEENERLRREKTQIQLENYKQKQQELTLKDNEVKLSCKLKSLQEEYDENKKQADTMLRVKDQLHDEKVKELQQSATVEKNMLQKDLQTVEGLLSHKETELQYINQEKNQANRELYKTQVEARQHEQSSQIWRERATSAEKEVQYVQRKSIQEQDELRKKLQRDHSIERMVMEDKIKTLQNIVMKKENELQNTHLSLAETNQKKREVELAKMRLQNAVEELEKKNEETVQSHTVQLRVKDQIHNEQIQNMKSSHDFEKERLNRNMEGLRYVSQKTMEERDQERLRALNAERESMRSAERMKKAENDAQFWQLHSSSVEKKRIQENEQLNNLRVSQLGALQQQHSREISMKDRETENLKHVLGTKEQQNRELALNSSIARQQAMESQRLANNASMEANLWREKASEEQNKRTLDNLVNEDLRRSDLLRSSIIQSEQKLAYQKEVNGLNDMLDRKNQEAEDWRHNYHRVLNSKY